MIFFMFKIDFGRKDTKKWQKNTKIGGINLALHDLCCLFARKITYRNDYFTVYLQPKTNNDK